MGRPRRQEPKRAHLVAAAQRVLARDGLVGLRVREVAAEAQVSPGSVIYYYPDSFQLAVEALDLAIKAKASDRSAVAASIPHPARRLAALVDMSMPQEIPGIAQAVLEAAMQVSDHPELRPVLEEMLSRNVHVFAQAIADGVDSGMFRAGLDAELVARSLVANLHAAQGYRSSGVQTLAETRTWVLAALELVLGCSLPEAGSLEEPLAATASPQLDGVATTPTELEARR